MHSAKAKESSPHVGNGVPPNALTQSPSMSMIMGEQERVTNQKKKAKLCKVIPIVIQTHTHNSLIHK